MKNEKAPKLKFTLKAPNPKPNVPTCKLCGDPNYNGQPTCDLCINFMQ